MNCVRRFIVVLLLLAPCAAQAQNCNFTVGYTDFGSINAVSSEPADIVGGIAIYCSGFSTPMVRMCLNLGLTDQRQLRSATNTPLSYNLYVDPDHIGVWGSVTAPGTQPLILDLPVHPSGNVWANEPFYGRIPPHQNVPAAQYSMDFSAAQTTFIYVGYSGTPPDCKTASSPYKSAAFEVRANVGIDCEISAAPMSFPDTGLLNRPLFAVSSITVTCTTGTSYYVDMDGGTTPGGTMPQRKLQRSNGPETIDYQLYLDAARTQIWGDGSRGTWRLGSDGTGTPHTNSVYGTVPIQPSKPAGHYSDTITATVIF
jgi:spore coat protein U-like protein